MTDEQIDRLKRGGHDIVKIYAAYAAAAQHRGQPRSSPAHTKKGYGMGSAGQADDHPLAEEAGRNRADRDSATASTCRSRDEQATSLAFYKPRKTASSCVTCGAAGRARRLPAGRRRATACACHRFHAQFRSRRTAEMGTMAFARMLQSLLRDATLGERIVPIVPTKRAPSAWPICSSRSASIPAWGQRYAPGDIGSVLSYREALDGQILEEGISEAGAISSWTAAATSYSVHGTPMLPFYIYYSMFGFQRVADLIWAAADQQPRGFLLGATSGRTTLGGEACSIRMAPATCGPDRAQLQGL